MDDPNITMEEYIRLEEEKARRHGKVYNWETATYGRIWDEDEVHNLRSVETKFPAIVFDDTFTSQATLSCEPMVSPLNDNEIDFRISFDESDDEDYTDNDDKPWGDVSVIPLPDEINTDIGAYAQGSNKLLKTNIALPPRDQRHQYLRFEGLEYTDADITDFEEILGRIYGRGIHRVQGLHTAEEIELVGFPAVYWAESARRSLIRGSECLRGRLIACSIAQRSQAPKKVTVTDMFYMRGMDVGSVNIHYLLARLQICEELDHTWAWVAPGPERQPDVAAGTPKVAEGAPDVDEGDQAVPAPVQAPQPPLAVGPYRTMTQRITRLEEDMHGMRGALASIERYTSYADFQIPYVRCIRRRTDDTDTSAPQQPDP
ncbi:hypothetical protein Tco_1218848 [Tanacetum coccineum]